MCSSVHFAYKLLVDVHEVDVFGYDYSSKARCAAGVVVQAAVQSTTELLSVFLPDTVRNRSLKEPCNQRARHSSTHLMGFDLPLMLLDPLEPEDLVPVSVER